MLKFANTHEPAVAFEQFLTDIESHRKQAKMDDPEWYDREAHVVGIHSGIHNGKRYYAVADHDGIECIAIEIEESLEFWDTVWEAEWDEEIIDE